MDKLRKILLPCLTFLFCFISADLGRAENHADAGTPVSLILQWKHQSQFAGYYMALEKGLYSGRGLDVTIVQGGPDRDPLEYLRTGRADFAMLWLVSAIEAAAQGVSLKNIAQVVNRSNLILMAWKDSGVKSVEDLDGRRVGLWEGQFRPPFIAFFRMQGIEPVVIQQNYSINLFLRHGVDACAAMDYNEYNMLYQAGVDLDELAVFPLASDNMPFPEDGIYCMSVMFRENPELCDAMAKASMEGWKYAAKYPEETLDVVMMYVSEANVPANRAHMRWMLETILSSIFPGRDGGWDPGRLSVDDYSKTARMMLGYGMITNLPSFNEFTVKEF